MTAEIEKRYRIINRIKSKIMEIETAEIEECRYMDRAKNSVVMKARKMLDFIDT